MRVLHVTGSQPGASIRVVAQAASKGSMTHSEESENLPSSLYMTGLWHCDWKERGANLVPFLSYLWHFSTTTSKFSSFFRCQQRVIIHLQSLSHLSQCHAYLFFLLFKTLNMVFIQNAFNHHNSAICSIQLQQVLQIFPNPNLTKCR